MGKGSIKNLGDWVDDERRCDVCDLSLRGKTMSKKERREGSHSMRTEGKGENYYMRTTGVDSRSG
jgi:hypothetical protein